MKPLAIDLFCGLGGWTDGLLAEGYDVIGFDIERHQYGDHGYAGHLVIQDVLTLHGAQFADAALIVASPPCQAYSYRAMPWKRAKALPPPDNTLFDACFRIQREACEAAGRHIPMIVENVRGAQPYVGRARWNYGSFYLWGDVPALMPVISNRAILKPQITNRRHGTGSWFAIDMKSARAGITNPSQIEGVKNPGQDWNRFKKTGEVSPDWKMEGVKGSEGYERDHPNAFGWKKPGTNSKSPSRKFASAMIAKIPLPLSRYIAATFRPQLREAAE